jgi:NEDD8-activating enzyme E1 regulatory subunit
VSLLKHRATCAKYATAEGLSTRRVGKETCARSQAVQDDETWNEGIIFLTMVAAEQFEEQHGRKAGETQAPADKSWELDIPHLQQLVSAMIAELGLPAKCVKDDVLLEACRCAGTTLHVTGAILGGIAAQEAIKVLLHQFVPVKGVFVFDGIHASSSVLDT